jgi:hypothetical protein
MDDILSNGGIGFQAGFPDLYLYLETNKALSSDATADFLQPMLRRAKTKTLLPFASRVCGGADSRRRLALALPPNADHLVSLS